MKSPTDETFNLKDLLAEALVYLEDYKDEGPCCYGWQSDGLSKLICNIRRIVVDKTHT